MFSSLLPPCLPTFLSPPSSSLPPPSLSLLPPFSPYPMTPRYGTRGLAGVLDVGRDEEKKQRLYVFLCIHTVLTPLL